RAARGRRAGDRNLLGGYHLVAAAGLGHREGDVGALKQERALDLPGLERRAAGGDRGGQALAGAGVDGLLRERGPDLLGDTDRLVAARTLEDHHELLAAVTRKEVAVPNPCRERVREEAEHTVADLVAEALVDAAEVVEVEQDRRAGTSLLRRDPQAQRVLAFDGRIEMAPVVNPRQHVGDRRVAGLLVETGIGQGEADLAREERRDLLLLCSERGAEVAAQPGHDAGD